VGHYAHYYITTCPSGFSDLPMALKGYVMDDCTLPGKLLLIFGLMYCK
jgi:hypothetical protein